MSTSEFEEYCAEFGLEDGEELEKDSMSSLLLSLDLLDLDSETVSTS